MLTTMDETCVLPDGTRLVVRHIRPDDAVKLRRAFHALSESSRYQRFMGQVADLTPAMLSYLTCVDGVDHVALVAMRLDQEERERELVAVARAIRVMRGGPVAEIAITVGDPLQRQGLGHMLMRALVERMQRQGVETLVAHALPSNRAIRGLLREYGALSEAQDQVLRVTLQPAGGALVALARRLTAAIPRRRTNDTRAA